MKRRTLKKRVRREERDWLKYLKRLVGSHLRCWARIDPWRRGELTVNGTRNLVVGVDLAVGLDETSVHIFRLQPWGPA